LKVLSRDSIYGAKDVQPPPSASINVFLRIRKAQVNSAPVEIGSFYILLFGSLLEAHREARRKM
jgi:hypothetical protein